MVVRFSEGQTIVTVTPKPALENSITGHLGSALLREPAFFDSMRQIDAFIQNINRAIVTPPAWLNDFNRRQAEFAEKINSLLKPVAAFTVTMAPTMLLFQQVDLVSKAHWIAHPSLPIADIVGQEKDVEVVGANLTNYVEAHLEEIYQSLEGRFSGYDAGKETKEFAFELIEAHRRRLFHLIVPAVFPEIERCGREVLDLGAGKGSKAVIEAFKDGIGNLGISQIGSLQALSAFSMMDDYFYKSFRTNSEAEQFRSMIHRHGSQHGLLRYNGSRDCLNAIFLFDFVLLGCDALRRA